MSLRQRNVQSSDRISTQGHVINTQPGQPIGGRQYDPAYQNVSLGQQVWMPRPSRLDSCPAGLEYLTQIDQILVKQQVELIEVFTSWQGRNSYRLLNSVGEQVYFAKEESNVCERQIFGTNRSFAMHIIDNLGTNFEYIPERQEPFPLRWTAPEAIEYKIFTFKSDVWSFGILLMEIAMFGLLPYAEMADEEILPYLKQSPENRMECPKHCHPELYQIMQMCWKLNRAKRPTFKELKKNLIRFDNLKQ